ncbi:hypothetical protein FACS1894125_4930 [Actinomycetota bacterium]|nr:hypothetical protein FACS1894125_4930 [Actinomycetota bacterium]
MYETEKFFVNIFVSMCYTIDMAQRVKFSEMNAGGKILAVVSDLLFTFAFLIFLYLLYMLYWTAVPAYYEQKELVESIDWDMPDDEFMNTPAVPLDFMPCDVDSKDHYKILFGENWKPQYDANWKEPSKENTMIGRSYIPRFGAENTANIVQGTDKVRVLDRQGFGHYENTVMPGCVGNFSAAAHRDGYGAQLGDVEKLKVGDALIIRTQHFWYVYKMYEYQIVPPEQGDVIAPVPGNPNAIPSDRLLTYTTCHPRWSMDQRYIIHAKFSYWATVRSGVPQELLDVGAKIRK